MNAARRALAERLHEASEAAIADGLDREEAVNVALNLALAGVLLHVGNLQTARILVEFATTFAEHPDPTVH